MTSSSQPWWPRQVQQLARICWTRLGDWRWLGAKEELDSPSSTSFTRGLVAEIYDTKQGFYSRRVWGCSSRLTFFQQQQSGQARFGWQPARERLTRAFRLFRRTRVRRRPTKAPPRANTHGAHQVV